MRVEGRLSQWDTESGFGLLKPARGGADVLVHQSAFPPDAEPAVGDWLSVAGEPRQDGRMRVRRVERHWSGRRKGHRPSFDLVIALLFALALVLLTSFGVLARFWLLAYACVSAMTYGLYAIDKLSARQKKQRISERTLHFCALFGGWPGALLAQQRLRHKSVKQPFRTVFWATVLINVAGLIVALSPHGAHWLGDLFRVLGS